MRLGGKDTIPLTEEAKTSILNVVRRYGSGADTLRCLAMAVVDDPIDPKDMQLENAANFKKYEVSCVFCPPYDGMRFVDDSKRFGAIRFDLSLVPLTGCQ